MHDILHEVIKAVLVSFFILWVLKESLALFFGP